VALADLDGPPVRASLARLLFHKVVRLALILASTSAIRRQMLDAAGVDYQAVKPHVDEAAVKARLSDATAVAGELAAAKACSVSGEWVIGSDSVVSVAGRLFDKPRDRDDAAEHLRFFSGKAMELTSAVALARNGILDWSHAETPRLQVRPLSDQFIAAYLDAEWPEVGYTVGVFRLEGRGVQLFETIDGDHFTILGMPLLPLLGALRTRGLMPA
jgi:septum formation protein